MSQLHEVLAVEDDLLKRKEKIYEETKHVFSKKPQIFHGSSRKLIMFDEERSKEETFEETDLTSTISEKLEYVKNYFIDYWDLKLTKENANCKARADIIVDGTKMAEDIPVVFLLAMEKELKQLRNLFDDIPTLSSGNRWEEDKVRGRNIKRATRPVEKPKTEKQLQTQVVFKPTDKQAGQYEKWFVDKPVGNYIEEHWSGELSPAEKSVLLDKIDKIIKGIKEARQRANTEIVEQRSIGKILFEFLNL